MPIQWVETARYLGATLDKRLNWSAHVNKLRKRAAQGLGVLGPLLNRRSGLSVRNCVLLYRKLNLPVMDYAWPIRGPLRRATSKTASHKIFDSKFVDAGKS
jgi:hypothetical protein